MSETNGHGAPVETRTDHASIAESLLEIAADHEAARVEVTTMALAHAVLALTAQLRQIDATR